MRNTYTRWLCAVTVGLLSFNLQALPSSPYFIVADDYIAPDMVEEHEQALREFKVQVDKTGYRGSWLFYQFDDGRHVAFSKQASHDFQALNDEKWQEVEDKFDPEFLTQNSAVYSKSIADQDFFMLRHMPELSNEPDIDKKKQLPNFVWMEIQLHRKPARAHLQKWIEQQKSAKSPFFVSAYSKQYGTNLPTVYLVFHVKSFVEYYQQLDKLGTHDPLTLMPEEFRHAVKHYKVSLAKYVPEISY